MSKIFLVLLLGGVLMGMAKRDPEEFHKLWNFGKPAETEVKFRALLPEAEKSGDAEYHLQLLTQIARTQSLQSKFDEAHKILDGVEKKLDKNTPVAEVRYLLERGRTFNSAKKISEALLLFQKAYELGVSRKLDFYAVDALHMLAIAEPDPAKKMEYNLKAVKMAEASSEEKARGWLASLYNNIGWDYHTAGKYQEALDLFEKALVLREKKGDVPNIRFAKWCIAKTLRFLRRYDESLKIQLTLEKEWAEAKDVDGYVFEELGELYLVTEKKAEAKKYFGLAYDEFVKSVWFQANETGRLARIKELGGR